MKIKVFALLIVASSLGLHAPANAQSLAGLSASDRASILSACNVDREFSGAAAYHACLNNQLRDLNQVGKAPSLAALSYSDRASILSACTVDREFSGAAAYHACLNNQLRDLNQVGKAPSLAALSYGDRASILSACNVDREFSGAAAYHACLNNQLRDLAQFGKSAVAPRGITSTPNCAGIGCGAAATFAQRHLTTAPIRPTTSTAAANSKVPSLFPGTNSTIAAPSTSTGPCAENGSCYGDISAATGLPKTVAVSGYYRADGTYVRGYYRSHK